MPMYTVQEGDCLSSIAKDFGFADWHTIYNDPQNADFRAKRPNPNIIFAGDQLFIPDKQPKDENRGTGAQHDFQLNGQKTTIRIRLEDEEFKPFAGKKFRLELKKDVTESTVPADGIIEKEIPANLKEGKLTVWLGDDTSQPGFLWNLKIGHLDPVEENKGVQARLKNLGFDCGPVDGIVGPKTKAALQGFQSRTQLPETGAADDATKDKLRQLHDEP